MRQDQELIQTLIHLCKPTHVYWCNRGLHYAVTPYTILRGCHMGCHG